MSELSLGPIRRVSTTDAVAEQILGLIRAGALGPGDQLPSERELVGTLKAARTSVREALRGLASLNVIEIRPGRGVFVREFDSQHVLEPAMLSLLLKQEAAASVSRARYVLEPEVIASAAESATEDDLERIAEAFGRMELDHDSLQRDSAPHLAFHLAIAEATHNQVLINIERYLIELVVGTADRKSASWSDEEYLAYWERSLEQHRAIVCCLRARDAAGAREASRIHLLDSREREHEERAQRILSGDHP